MKPLTLQDLFSYDEYERIRPTYRDRIIALKKRRRIAVGDLVSLIFENRDTLQFQVQEMVRAEHILDPTKVQEELDVYNALLPADGELSATLLIEITESDRIQPLLDRFQGIDQANVVGLKVGGQTVYGEFEGGHSKDDKLSAVHFVRFRPHHEFLESLEDGSTPASIRIDHPGYQEEVPVPEALREEWLSDIHRGPDSLISQDMLS